MRRQCRYRELVPDARMPANFLCPYLRLCFPFQFATFVLHDALQLAQYQLIPRDTFQFSQSDYAIPSCPDTRQFAAEPAQLQRAPSLPLAIANPDTAEI